MKHYQVLMQKTGLVQPNGPKIRWKSRPVLDFVKGPSWCKRSPAQRLLNKSKWTEKVPARYSIQGTTPFASAPQWIPDVAIIDAMFAINTNPLRQHKTLEQYAYLLFCQYMCIVPHFQHGTNKVYLMFDHPGSVPFNAKECEHKRRCSQGKTSTQEHTLVSYTPQSTIPRPWREYLECRPCKRSLVKALGWVYLRTGMHYLHEAQNFVLAGCFSGETQDDAWIITGGSHNPPRRTKPVPWKQTCVSGHMPCKVSAKDFSIFSWHRRLQ